MSILASPCDWAGIIELGVDQTTARLLTLKELAGSSVGTWRSFRVSSREESPGSTGQGAR